MKDILLIVIKNLELLKNTSRIKGVWSYDIQNIIALLDKHYSLKIKFNRVIRLGVEADSIFLDLNLLIATGKIDFDFQRGYYLTDYGKKYLKKNWNSIYEDVDKFIQNWLKRNTLSEIAREAKEIFFAKRKKVRIYA